MKNVPLPRVSLLRSTPVGNVPANLPRPHIPEIQFAWLSQMSGSALAIACLGLLEALAIAKAIAHQTRQSLDFNRQCLAEGLANLAGGFLQCLPGSGSLTRSAINFQAGAASRMSGIFAAGGDTEESHGDGLFLSHDERYAQTDEFLDIWRALDRGETVNHTGEYYRTEGARDLFRPFQPHIPLYLGGSSAAALRVAAKHIDLYLTWGEPPAVAEKIARARELAGAEGRELRFGIRMHVIVRDSNQEARRDAEKLIEHVTPEIAERGQQALAKYDSDGQKRMLALQRGGRDGLWLRPDLWAGVGQVRGGAGTAMVGDGATVASLMQKYAALGIDTFILSGYPHLEEAYNFAEHVFPRLSLVAPVSESRRGEVVANGAVSVADGRSEFRSAIQTTPPPRR
jgi:alkanesulfonate monooxygenase